MSVFQAVSDELAQSQSLRTNLLHKISEHFDRYVVTFYTNFNTNQGSISDSDVELVEDILQARQGDQKKLLLIINSPGGNPLAAERFIKVCRTYSENDFWALVPGRAKSAATMISLGASKVIMTPTSELGPIDVQVPWKDELVPAHIIISSYEDLLNQGINLPKEKNIDPILQQLQVFDEPQIERYRMARDLSGDIAQKVLQEGMFSGVPENEVIQLLDSFINPKELKDHGRPVFYSDIEKIDANRRFKIELIEPEHDIYGTIHEYHLRVALAMNSSRLAKVCETEENSFTVNILG